MARKKTPKKTKKNRTQKYKDKLWGLEKRTFPKNIQHYLDWDYIDEAFLRDNPEAAKWYSQFIEEEYGNTFKKKGKKSVKTKKGTIRKMPVYDDKKNLNKGSEAKRAVFKRNNERQRDVYNQRLQSGLDSSLYADKSYGSEDSMIDYLDQKRELDYKIKRIKKDDED